VHTFHSYAYKILEQSIDSIDVDNVIDKAIEQLDDLKKTVIVIDEYQDVNDKQFNFLKRIIEKCISKPKIIAAGDDDQNIYEFNGANLKYINSFETEFKAKTFYLIYNYRSPQNLVDFSQKWIKLLKDRKKLQNLISKKS
jgi:ATP-dependent DNA helicase RecQ